MRALAQQSVAASKRSEKTASRRGEQGKQRLGVGYFHKQDNFSFF